MHRLLTRDYASEYLRRKGEAEDREVEMPIRRSRGVGVTLRNGSSYPKVTGHGPGLGRRLPVRFRNPRFDIIVAKWFP
jgi:hypothetical protein